MTRYVPLVSTIFVLLLLLLVATETGPMMVAEAKAKKPKTCHAKSRRFKGTCLSTPNCANVCRHEGFSGGRCRGSRHICSCTKQC